MPVRYGNLNTGGTPPVTQVSDTFARSTLNVPGQLVWMHEPLILLPITNPLCIGEATCPGTGNISLSSQANGGGGTGTYWSTLLPAINLFKGVNGKTQFCQSTFQGFVGTAFTACGNMVMGSWDGINSSVGWYGIVHRNAGLTAVEKASVTGNVLGNTILFTDIAPVVGDVWRLSFNTATNTVTATKNNTVVYSAVDGVSPLTTGIPGLQMRSVNQTAGVSAGVLLSNVSCGLGL